jgi:CHAP domain-containing protein
MFLKLFGNLLRSLATPPSIPSNAKEMGEAEREIDEYVEPEALTRARSMVGKGYYCLGAGGKNPNALDPWSGCAKPATHGHEGLGRVFSDCSGFIAWCWRLPRHDKTTDTWLNTDELEARGKRQGIPWHKAQPGDVVAYGAGAAIGHCGIASEVDDAGPTKVIHCNAGKAPAVDETSADLFERHGAVIWRP